ncbi:NADPH-dependent FMN reductase [Basfia succiniciproducens]|uniref:NADPH-dependent FMN reductase n=1 Tax=Basfia succiniciproducens TaxID=653940 RepID=UPI0008D05A17|nr:NAD(P)H-dependent oxidoreductase [Basfia succiniciproducens]SEQ18099.1 NAD(P)H-dependent FMN reductase [Basfia succiniciproducens]
MTKQIAVLIGSGSTTSFSKLVVSHLQKMAPASIQLNIVEIADLPLYDRDLDENSPAQYTRVREQIANADGVILVSPEHNGAISAMLKNAIDVVSRPMGQSKWFGKPAGIVTVAAGMAGGVRVADQLRTIASGSFIGMPVYQQNACIGGLFNGVFDQNGEITIDAVKQMLQQFIDGYAEFVAKF